MHNLVIFATLYVISSISAAFGAPVATCSLLANGQTLSCFKAISSEAINGLDLSQVNLLKFKGAILDWTFLRDQLPKLSAVHCLEPAVSCAGFPLDIGTSCQCRDQSTSTTLQQPTPTIPSTTPFQTPRFALAAPFGTMTGQEEVTPIISNQTLQCKLSLEHGWGHFWANLDSFACFNEFVGGAGASTGIILAIITFTMTALYSTYRVLFVTGRRLHAVSTTFYYPFFKLHSIVCSCS